MLSDFERKVKQIILNDRITGRVTSISDLEQRTGHERQEIKETIAKLKSIPTFRGGLKK